MNAKFVSQKVTNYKEITRYIVEFGIDETSITISKKGIEIESNLHFDEACRVLNALCEILEDNSITLRHDGMPFMSRATVKIEEIE